MSRKTKVDMYLADRAKGMTYREIGEKYGVSGQSVHCCCMKQGIPGRQVITPRGCIYPNLRNWLNENKARQDAFFKATEGTTIRDVLKGIRQPKKDVIDKMIAITGMTYEVLFAEETHG